MKYRVGQNVVHLSHGVGKIVALEEREFSPGKKTSFYILNIHDGGAVKKVFVPTDSAESKLRSIMKASDVAKVYEVLKAPNTEVDHSTWNRRYRTYMEQIHTGQALQVAQVLASLWALKRQHELSFGERKLFEQARSLLVGEMVLSTGKTEKEIESELESALCQSDN